MISTFDNVFLDFDGVLFDTNKLKQSAIIEASNGFMTPVHQNKFIKYFIDNNGLPRELKIKKFYPKHFNIILKAYNEILNKTIFDADLTAGAYEFLFNCKSQLKKIFILSGGEIDEIETLLKKNNIIHFFDNIFCSPNLKKETLQKFNNTNSVFIGDSKIDFEASSETDVSFIFMTQYSQFHNWKNFFNGKNVSTIMNLGEL